MQGLEGGDFFECFYQKILPVPCVEKSPYIESESIRPIKSLIKIVISIVLEI